MPDGRPALTGAKRKHRYDRRLRDGLIYVRAELPPEIGEWLIDHSTMAGDNSTGRGAETLPTRLRSGSKPDISASATHPAPENEWARAHFG